MSNISFKRSLMVAAALISLPLAASADGNRFGFTTNNPWAGKVVGIDAEQRGNTNVSSVDNSANIHTFKLNQLGNNNNFILTNYTYNTNAANFNIKQQGDRNNVNLYMQNTVPGSAGPISVYQTTVSVTGNDNALDLRSTQNQQGRAWAAYNNEVTVNGNRNRFTDGVNGEKFYWRAGMPGTTISGDDNVINRASGSSGITQNLTVAGNSNTLDLLETGGAGSHSMTVNGSSNTVKTRHLAGSESSANSETYRITGNSNILNSETYGTNINVNGTINGSSNKMDINVGAAAGYPRENNTINASIDGNSNIMQITSNVSNSTYNALQVGNNNYMKLANYNNGSTTNNNITAEQRGSYNSLSLTFNGSTGGRAYVTQTGNNLRYSGGTSVPNAYIEVHQRN